MISEFNTQLSGSGGLQQCFFNLRGVKWTDKPLLPLSSLTTVNTAFLVNKIMTNPFSISFSDTFLATTYEKNNKPWERTLVPAYGNTCFGDAADLWLMYDLRKSQTFTELPHVNSTHFHTQKAPSKEIWTMDTAIVFYKQVIPHIQQCFTISSVAVEVYFFC